MASYRRKTVYARRYPKPSLLNNLLFRLSVLNPLTPKEFPMLNMQAMSHGYAVNRWLTFQQARALGACVRKGESGTGIVFFKMLERDADSSRCANDEPARRVIPLLRSFTVFNAAQIEGLPEGLVAPDATPEGWSPVAAAEELLTRSGVTISHGGDQAFYRPSDDIIQLPSPAVFPEASRYYNVALHELTQQPGTQAGATGFCLDASI